MRFLLDENFDVRVAGFLTDRGHDVTVVGRDYPRGLGDEQVLTIALAEDRILITDDRDFGELVFVLGQPHSGIVLFRLGNTSLRLRLQRLEAVLSQHTPDLGEFLVVTERAVRVRRRSE